MFCWVYFSVDNFYSVVASMVFTFTLTSFPSHAIQNIAKKFSRDLYFDHGPPLFEHFYLSAVSNKKCSLSSLSNLVRTPLHWSLLTFVVQVDKGNLMDILWLKTSFSSVLEGSRICLRMLSIFFSLSDQTFPGKSH